MADQRPRVIMIVDDDPFVRESTATLLVALSYAVLDAGNGNDAIALARDGRLFDAVLVDRHMPGGPDGIETMRALRQLRPDLPFVLVTGDDAGDVSLDGELAGGLALGKPFRMTDLRRALEQVLGTG